MGSCGNLITVNEPTNVEDNPCSEPSVHPVTELAGCSYNLGADPTGVPDKCLSSSQEVNAACVCPSEETGLLPFDIKEKEIVDVLATEEMSAYEYASDGFMVDFHQDELDTGGVGDGLDKECPSSEQKVRNTFDGLKVSEELHPMSSSPRNCVQQGDGESDGDYVTGGAFEDTRSIHTHASDSVLPPHASEIPDKLTNDWSSLSVQREEQMDATSVSPTLAEEGLHLRDIKDSASVGLGDDISIYMLQKASENGSSTYAEIGGPRAENMEFSSEEGPTRNSVDKSNMLTDTKGDANMQELPLEHYTCNSMICVQNLPLEKSACNSKHDLFENSPKYFSEELVSGLSDPPFGTVNKAHPERLDAPDNAVSTLSDQPSGVINSISRSEFCGGRAKTDNVINRADHVSEYMNPDFVCSSHQCSTFTSKSTQKKQTRRKSRNRAVSRRKGKVEISFEISRRKRSNLLKPARSSSWGSLDNITKIFCPNLDMSKESPKEIFSQVRGKNIEKGASICTQDSRQTPAPIPRLRVKFKFKRDLGESCINSEFQNIVDESVSRISCIDIKDQLYPESTSDMPKLDGRPEEKLVGDEGGKQVQHPEKNLEKEGHSDDSNLDVSSTNEDLEGVMVSDKAARLSAGEGPMASLTIAGEELGGEVQNKYVDSGTSPDSEVINSIPDAQAIAGCQEGFHDAVPTSSKDFGSPVGVISTRKGNRKDKRSGTSTKISAHTSSSKETVDRCPGQALAIEGGVDGKNNLMLDADPELLQSPDSKILTHMSKKEKRSLKNSKSGKGGKSRPKSSDEGKIRRGAVNRQRGKQKKTVNECKVNDSSGNEPIMCGLGDEGDTGIDDVKETAVTEKFSFIDASNLEMVSNGFADQHPPPSQAWVSCDDCHKWRRISPSLLESIENCRWVCKDNLDKTFADCSIPQEKSNAEINRELDISDCEEDGSNYRTAEPGGRKDVNDGRFKAIVTNEFLHRSRKAQTIDEIMVCHCIPPQDGSLGCGDECLNRMLNIECVQGTCPCGDRCSNQQFQRRQWSKLEWFRCGKKGFGLRSVDDISNGQFLIEYVGEVLDMHAYEKRQKEYADDGHKHFYFMTLNGSEVIDACGKGNLGRFINHSCEPNCRTEKWMVNGEICIGLFAVRDIKKGEELTFDYNYVRVFGAAAKKCYCGSSQCRGYIGGDLLNSEVVVQGDSDEEYPEPVMVYGDGKTETRVNLDNTVPSNISCNGLEMDTALDEMNEKLDKSTATVRQPEINAEIDTTNTSLSAVSQLQNTPDLDNPTHGLIPSQVDMLLQKDSRPNSVQEEISMEKQIVDKGLSSNKDLESSLPKNLINLPFDANRKSKSEVEQKPALSKSRPLMKTSRTSGSVKRGKVSSTMNSNKALLVTGKSELLPAKSRKSLQGSDYGRFEEVEGKLNELLDADGGISKRKDAAKGYLKLLLLTAASGNSSNGEAIQSNRDLSMILDAILKTKSRAVLTDIINKNGLRMLHNIMKQYRRDFKKIPILRKLLKVLEYLAVREILTLEHINGGPPCPGMESFRVSMLSLTEHEDKQVHQIARNFRDRWIPKHLRKLGCMDRDDGRADFHRSSKCSKFPVSQNYWNEHGVRPTEATDSVKHLMVATPPLDSSVQEGNSGSCTGANQTNVTRTRKRKSRWDQPAEVKLNKYPPQDESIRPSDGKKEFEDDVPPGFSSPIGRRMASTGVTEYSRLNVCHQKYSMEVVMGNPQAKFISRLPVSYGIPLSIVKQNGSPLTGRVEGWAVAPGTPFSPFPPLPPFPRDKKDQLPSCTMRPSATEQPVRQQDSCVPMASAGCTPPATGTNQPDTGTVGSNSQYTHKRPRGFSCDLGKRYFKQQKWNNAKFGPPWLWKRNGWGSMTNNPNNGSLCSNVMSDQRGPYCSEDVNCRVERTGNNFHQHPQHQNQH